MNLKPQDLRLGILIHDTVRNTNTTLQLKHFRELSISEEQFFNRYKPVAITEEMLLDFGFMGMNEWWFQNEKLNIEKMITKEVFNVRFRISDNESILMSEINYAHEIQSLYYDLNGEELNISKFL